MKQLTKYFEDEIVDGYRQCSFVLKGWFDWILRLENLTNWQKGAYILYFAYVIYILQGKKVTYTWDIMTALLIYANFMLSGYDKVEAESHI